MYISGIKYTKILEVKVQKSEQLASTHYPGRQILCQISFYNQLILANTDVVASQN